MISTMPDRLFVIDDFYADPDAVRAQALAAEYGPSETGRYPGRNAVKRRMDPNVVEAMQSIIGAPIRVRDTDAFGVFRLSSRNDKIGNFIHADPVTWGGVLYLNPVLSEPSGTAFWRHRETGLQAHPFSDWERYGFASESEAFSRLIARDGMDADNWELLQFIDGIFNRLILFDSRQYHSHMPKNNFGDSPESSRLVQVFFFEPARAVP